MTTTHAVFLVLFPQQAIEEWALLSQQKSSSALVRGSNGLLTGMSGAAAAGAAMAAAAGSKTAPSSWSNPSAKTVSGMMPVSEMSQAEKTLLGHI